MAREFEFVRQRVKECREHGKHIHPNPFAIEAANDLEASQRRFIEIYRDSNLRLELGFLTVNRGIDRPGGTAT